MGDVTGKHEGERMDMQENVRWSEKPRKREEKERERKRCRLQSVAEKRIGKKETVESEDER